LRPSSLTPTALRGSRPQVRGKVYSSGSMRRMSTSIGRPETPSVMRRREACTTSLGGEIHARPAWVTAKNPCSSSSVPQTCPPPAATPCAPWPKSPQKPPLIAAARFASRA
jgi:hypothetical protein